MTSEFSCRWSCEGSLHDYGEPLAAELVVYSLEEVVAEKLRAILQQLERLDNLDWMRNRARDYYSPSGTFCRRS